MSKTLNTDSITNELVHSSFFPRRVEDKPRAEVAPQPTPVRPAPPVVKRVQTSVVPPSPRTPVPPRRLIRQRQPFDIFDDQYRELKKIADEERYQGLPGSMSRMV